jgi:hypothetical protein
MIEEIKKLAEIRNQLAQQALEQYEPLVNNIIATQNKDVNHICNTMDFMLDFCFDDKMLLLYRRLCHYLLDIDPQATASYVQAYREMWDEDGTQFGMNKKINNS